MLFSSIEFLYYFLPVVILGYFLLPGQLRNGWLLLVSLVFYAWGEPKLISVMFASILLNWLWGIGIGRAQKQGWKRFFLVMSCLTCLGLLGWFKYADFALENLNALLGTSISLPKLLLPIGISFYSFQILSYTIDVYRGQAETQYSIIDFGCYVVLFPQLIAGPIVRYVDVQRELQSRRTTMEDFRLGLRRFLFGLGKKILIANQLGEFLEIFRSSGEKSLLFYWLYALGFCLHIYFDFSGYSDMAIGLGRIFGFHFLENFNYPYLSGSITEFWRRWHMSLGSWFRDYVYIPMGGNRVSKGRWVFNILTVWMLTGLWHGAAWNFVLWGLLFAAVLLAEKWIPGLRKLPGLLRHGYVLLIVVLSFVLFNAESLSQAGGDFAGMFGLTGLPLVTTETLYYLKSYALLFLAGVIGATPLVRDTANRIGSTKAGAVLEPLLLVGLLLVCSAYLVDGSFSPFLYFRF